MSGIITKVSGPLVVAEGLADANVSDVVRVGSQRLIGEILNMTGDSASIQVYEETSGLGPGAEVVTTGLPLSVELGPGMLENIYDGIQRPLPEIRALTGETITARRAGRPALNREKQVGLRPRGGARPACRRRATCSAPCRRRSAILHKIMVPPSLSGTVKSIEKGEFTVDHVVAVVEDYKGKAHELTMVQNWPVRIPRPYSQKYTPCPPDEQRPAYHRHAVPHRQGRHRGGPRPLRLGQDRRAAPARQVVGRGHRRLHRLRRARQRDDGRSDGVPGADRPAQRRAPHEAHRPHSEHLRHARRGPRGLHLHGHHHRRVLPRHGL